MTTDPFRIATFCTLGQRQVWHVVADDEDLEIEGGVFDSKPAAEEACAALNAAYAAGVAASWPDREEYTQAALQAWAEQIESECIASQLRAYLIPPEAMPWLHTAARHLKQHGWLVEEGGMWKFIDLPDGEGG